MKKNIKSIRKNLDHEEISITLERWMWEEIASACISVADWNDLNDDVIEALRKTYYQIKSEIR